MAYIQPVGSNYGSVSGVTENYFNVRLEGGSGEGATADVTVSTSSTISNMDINNAGSGYKKDDLHAYESSFSYTWELIQQLACHRYRRCWICRSIIGVGTSYDGIFHKKL